MSYLPFNSDIGGWPYFAVSYHGNRLNLLRCQWRHKQNDVIMTSYSTPLSIILAKFWNPMIKVIKSWHTAGDMSIFYVYLTTFGVSNADRNFYENSLETFCTINFWSWRTSNFPLTVMLILAKKGLRLAIFYLLILPVTPNFFSVFRMPNGWTTFVQFMKKIV